METELLQKLIQTAKEAGAPRDQVEQFLNHSHIPFPWQWHFHALAREADRPDGPVDIGLGGARGPGKQVADYTPVLTTDGFKRASDITLEDKLISIDGKPTKILGIYKSPVVKMYRVTFIDGASVDVDGRHLWRVWDTRKSKWRVKTTEEILSYGIKRKRGYYWAIPTLEKPVVGKKWSLPADPYILGYFIGNGTCKSRDTVIYTIDEEIVDYLKDQGWRCYRYDYSTCYSLSKGKDADIYRNLINRAKGEDKHIPSIVFESDEKTRLAVLQGLMDSDGSVDKRGRCTFKTISHELAYGLRHVVLSLGGIATVTRKERKSLRGGRDYIYQVYVRHNNKFNPFRLSRKADRVKTIRRHGFRSIVSVEETQSTPSRCFEVEHPSHLFVIKDYVLTHNSHAVLAQAGIDDCQRVPGLKGLFLRQTGKAAQESFDDLILKVLHGRVVYEKTLNTLKFPNGSRIVMGGFQTSKDIDKYIGIEYDFMIVEELNQITEDKYEKLRGSLRTSKPNWRPRIYTSFNPGGVGHIFVRDRYIYPTDARTKKEVRFVGSTYKSNPMLNKEYINYLEGLGGALGKAWRDGDFNAFDGQVFSELKDHTHALNPFIPRGEVRYVIWIDWGYSDTKKTAFSALLSAVIDKQTLDGQDYKQIITFKEWCGNKKEPQEWARIIYKDCKEMEIVPDSAITDPAMHSPLQDGGQSIAKQMKSEWKRLHGDDWIPVKKGSNSGINSRINRVGMMHGWMSINPATDLPYWMITRNCTNFWKYVPTLMHDDNQPEAYAKDGEENMADAASYGLERVKFMRVVAEAHNYKESKKSIGITFNSDGQQLPFSPDDFAKQYDEPNGIISLT